MDLPWTQHGLNMDFEDFVLKQEPYNTITINKKIG